MKLTHRKLLAALALLFLTLACRAATNLITPEDEYSDPAPTQFSPAPTNATDNITGAQSCPVLLSDIMTAANTEGSDAKAQDETYLVTYSVVGDKISDAQFETVPNDLKEEQEDTASQQLVWDYFTSIIPAEERSFVTEYSITTDGVDNTLAAVTQTYDDPSEWALQVDILDIKDTYNLTFTLVHEFGHLLTLNAEQVSPSIPVFNSPDDEDVLQKEVSACPEYFPGEGCSTSSSYINTWYNRFWVDIYDEWDKVNYAEDDDAYYEMLDNFYYKYEDQFVSDYAATTPEEDIAESWAFFVLAPKPNGNTIADQKVLFFYEYPELVQLRESILNNICEAFPH